MICLQSKVADQTLLTLILQIAVHCKCLQGITGYLQVLLVVGKPCNIYRLRGNPIIIMSFPRNL